MAGAFETGKYRNVFAEYGYPEAEIQRRVEQTFETIFYGNEEERFYHEVGADMAYIEDTGNHDVRTEGMSYGMMARRQSCRLAVPGDGCPWSGNRGFAIYLRG